MDCPAINTFLDLVYSDEVDTFNPTFVILIRRAKNLRPNQCIFEFLHFCSALTSRSYFFEVDYIGNRKLWGLVVLENRTSVILVYYSIHVLQSFRGTSVEIKTIADSI